MSQRTILESLGWELERKAASSKELTLACHMLFSIEARIYRLASSVLTYLVAHVRESSPDQHEQWQTVQLMT